MTNERDERTSTMPMVIDLDGAGSLDAWVAAAPGWVDSLVEHGAVIFRNAGVGSVGDFDHAVSLLVRPDTEFGEESSPRTALSAKVFTSTEYPAPFPIQFHNEFSYRRAMPECLVFACLNAPETGGSTPIADGRAMLRALPDEVVDRFAGGVRYVRNFCGLGVPWPSAFGTDSRAEVDAYCAANGVGARWSDKGLHTWQDAPAVRTHPVSGERTWCNSALNLNVRGTEPAEVHEALLAVEPELRPNDTFFADGSEIGPEDIAALRAAYEEVAYRHPWGTGDVMIIDNALMSHARDPFTGPRRVVVGMGARTA
ncbi:TauD/TfdA family dioxygenase [Streptomyces clavuligerus]|nr:TauD/TfdA family dioxygenase [Streptomyces clavuligerus]WDN54491.1 TauD/TfdA family dioxygenase [Streptomyces clavuligerus]